MCLVCNERMSCALQTAEVPLGERGSSGGRHVRSRCEGRYDTMFA